MLRRIAHLFDGEHQRRILVDVDVVDVAAVLDEQLGDLLDHLALLLVAARTALLAAEREQSESQSHHVT